MDSLERRYRRLLFAYPPAYRHRRADEIVGTFLDLAAPGQTRPRVTDALDLLHAGVRQRIGSTANADLRAGWALAGPVALALAAGLSGFLWLAVEPLVGGSVAPIAYAAWLLALAGWVALPGRYARWPVAGALAVTALTVALPSRPPLWVVLSLLAFGGLALTAAAPRGATTRLAVVTGALVAAALGKWLLAGALTASRWTAGYYQPVLSMAGLVVAAAVAAVAAGGVFAAVEGRRVRPWLWAALLLALPGGWLGPRGAAAGPGFGRLAEVLLATCVVLAAMAALGGVRGSTLPRAGGVAVGCAAGLGGYLAWGGVPGFGLIALVLLGFIALLCPPDGWRAPLGTCLASVAAAAVVTWYDNGWRLTATVPFGHSARLVVMLAIVPFTVAALAGAAALRTHRVRGALLLLTGTGWVGAVTVPHLAAWGPILVLVPVAAAAAGTVAFVRTRRRWSTRV